MLNRTFTSLTDLLLGQAAKAPDRPALVFLEENAGVGRQITFAELARSASGVAALLRDHGVSARRNVLVALPSGPAFVAAFFGCALAGSVPVPCSPPGNPRHDTRFPALLYASRAAAVLAESAAIQKLQGAPASEFNSESGKSRAWPRGSAAPSTRWVGIGDLSRLPAGDLFLRRPPKPGEIAFIQYSSGSTAEPRGVVVLQANLAANVASIRRIFRLGPRASVVSWLPMHHDMGLVATTLVPFASGNTVFLVAPRTFARDPLRWLEAISGREDVWSGGPNFAYDSCASRSLASPERAARLALGGWTTAFVGAEPVSKATLERFAAAFAPCGFDPAAFRPGYGLAEATLMVSTALGPRTDPATNVVSCGPAGPGVAIAIADPATGAILSDGREGEIRVRGPSVASGYYRRPAETRKTFHASLRGRRGCWLRTGDLGYLRNGELHVTGRLKDVLIVRGGKHHPADLERSALEAMPASLGLAAAAFPLRTPLGERVAMAVELPRDRFRDEAARSEDVRAVRAAVCRRHGVLLEEVFACPKGFIPRTTSGKVRRFLCEEKRFEEFREDGRPGFRPEFSEQMPTEADSDVSGVDESAFSASERIIVDAIFRLARVRVSAAGENLFERGLDSLALLALLAELAELGFHLSTEEVVERPTIAGLAARLDAILDERGSSGPAAAGSDHSKSETQPGHRAETGEPGREFPLTRSQAYFLSPSAFANGRVVMAAISLPPQASPSTVEAALRRLTERHEALRLRVRLDAEGAMRQHVAPVDDCELLDLAASAESVRPGVSLIERGAVLVRLIDPESGPMLRGLYLEAPDQCGKTLLLGVHHICLDLASGALLFREFAENLGRLAVGQTLDDSPPPPGFGDYLAYLDEQAREAGDGRGASADETAERRVSSGASAGEPLAIREASFKLSAASTRDLLEKVFPARRWRPDLALAWCAAWALAKKTGLGRVCVRAFAHHRGGADIPPRFRWTAGMLASRWTAWPDVAGPGALDRFFTGQDIPFLDMPGQDGAAAGHLSRSRGDFGLIHFNYMGSLEAIFPARRGVSLVRLVAAGKGDVPAQAGKWKVGAVVKAARLEFGVSACLREADRDLPEAVAARMRGAIGGLLLVEGFEQSLGM